MASTLALFATSVGTGLLAGGASCAAVQGGLLAGAVTRRSPSPAPVPAPATARRGSGVGIKDRRTGSSPAAEPPAEPKALVPVGAFLAGKLISHTLLGALLGISATRSSPAHAPGP